MFAFPVGSGKELRKRRLKNNETSENSLFVFFFFQILPSGQTHQVVESFSRFRLRRKIGTTHVIPYVTRPYSLRVRRWYILIFHPNSLHHTSSAHSLNFPCRRRKFIQIHVEVIFAGIRAKQNCIFQQQQRKLCASSVKQNNKSNEFLHKETGALLLSLNASERKKKVGKVSLDTYRWATLIAIVISSRNH